MSGLHGYATGPSYLDQDQSHASELLVPDAKACYTYEDGTVANSTRATQPQEGIDALMGFGAVEMPPAGGYFTETSAGNDATVETSEGQLVPRGFLRNEPSIAEIMHQRPATLAQLGPRGPIYARKAGMETGHMPRVHTVPVPTLSSRLAAGGLPVRSTPQTVGLKRYTVPMVQRALEERNLTGPHYRTEFLKGQKTVAVQPMNIERLGKEAKPISLGEELADYEFTHTTICGMLNGLGNLMQNKRLPMYQQQKAEKELRSLILERDKLERKILELRQQMRGTIMPIKSFNRVRANAVMAQVPATVLERDTTLRPANSVNMSPSSVDGLGGVMDFVKNPLVYGPAIALAGVIAFKLFRRRR